MQIVEVVKVGGSLLDLPGLGEGIFEVVRGTGADVVLAVVGGGAAADHVRTFDRVHRLGELAGHWHAVGAMRLNTMMLKDVLVALGGTRVVGSVDEVRPLGNTPATAGEQGGGPMLCLVDPVAWLKHDDGRGHRTPKRWEFTSDSIAAHVAGQVGAGRLTLLKSRSVEPPCDIAGAASQGVVDGCFEAAAEGVPRVDMVNLREPSLRRVTLKGTP